MRSVRLGNEILCSNAMSTAGSISTSRISTVDEAYRRIDSTVYATLILWTCRYFNRSFCLFERCLSPSNVLSSPLKPLGLGGLVDMDR